MKKYVTLAILFAAMTAPLAAQESEPDEAPGSTDTPDDIRSFEQTDTRVVDRLPKPALTPESLTPQEKALLQGAYQGNLAEVQGLVAKGASVNLADIRQLMTLPDPPDTPVTTVAVMMQKLTGIDITTCPCCNQGKMLLLAKIPMHRARAPTHLLAAAR